MGKIRPSWIDELELWKVRAHRLMSVQVIRKLGEADMRPINVMTMAGLVAAIAVAGCSNNQTSGLSTASVAKPAATKLALDPTCVRLTSQINALRQEGTPSRVHQVANGKTKTAVIKRASLAKVAELDRLNAQFQMKCSKYPGLQTAAVPTTAPATTAATQARVAATTAQAARTASTSAARIAKPIVTVPKQ